MTITVGTQAPDFELPSSELNNGKPGKPIKLSDFRGKRSVVIAFYPLDFSPVCSSEVSCFRDDFAAFQGLDAQVLGVSVDSVWTHSAFAQKVGIDFPLLADFNPKGAVAELYGLYLADKGFNARATVIVDKHGVVAYVKVQGLGEPRSDSEILAELKKLA